MLELVIQEIRQTWKEGLLRGVTTGALYFILYLTVIPLSFMKLGVRGTIAYYATILPFFISVVLFNILPNRINKTLFFCPMSREDRKEFIIVSYWFRVGVSLGIYIFVQLVLCMIGILPVYGVFMLVFTYCPFILVFQSLDITGVTKPYFANMELSTEIASKGGAVVAIIFGIITLLGAFMFALDEFSNPKVALWVFGIFYLIQLGTSCYSWRHNFNPMVNAASIYEESMRNQNGKK